MERIRIGARGILNLGAHPPIWVPIAIVYSVIIGALSSLALIAYCRFEPFRVWLRQPINIFWLCWIILVVCSGGMIAMMLFPAADMVMGWGLLRFDGAFTGKDWIAANEIQTQVIVACFTASALINHPPALTELYLAIWHPNEVGLTFIREMTLRQRKWFLTFINCNCIFMYPLSFSTWMIPVAQRPFYYTVVFVPLSLGSGIAAGIYSTRVASKWRTLPDSQQPSSAREQHSPSSAPPALNLEAVALITLLTARSSVCSSTDMQALGAAMLDPHLQLHSPSSRSVYQQGHHQPTFASRAFQEEALEVEHVDSASLQPPPAKIKLFESPRVDELPPSAESEPRGAQHEATQPPRGELSSHAHASVVQRGPTARPAAASAQNSARPRVESTLRLSRYTDHSMDSATVTHEHVHPVSEVVMQFEHNRQMPAVKTAPAAKKTRL